MIRKRCASGFRHVLQRPIYTFLPTAGKMARYNPNMTSAGMPGTNESNPMTADLADVSLTRGRRIVYSYN
jgi:hypothetical protein